MTVALPPSMDFETYSEAGFILEPGGKVYSAAKSGKGGLPAVGTPVYASHPSTDILCLYYDLRDGRGRQGWMPGMPSPYELLEYVASGGPIEAFNITFEWWIWNMVAVRRYGWPPLQLDQCHCVMAKCRRYSLPGALGNVTKVMGTASKDKEGGRLIQKLTRPHTPTKNRPAARWTTATAWEDFQALYKYCDGDVLAEDEVSERVPDLSAHERDIWLADQYINARGVQVDTVTLEAALSILAQAEAKYNAELAELTGGAVLAATELGKLQEWLADQGVNMPNMQKQTIDDTVSTGSAWLPGPALRALEIRQLLGSANIKKLHSLKLQTNHDGRLRGQYMYCGADRSGRWSSSGVQLQNLTGKGPDAWRCSECGEVSGRNEGECRRCGQWAGLMERTDGWTIEGTEAAIEDIRTGDLATVERMWGGDPLTVLCGVLRGLLTAKPGHELICVDFSAIEAVVAACIARCQWRIDVFNTPGSDIYLESISRIKGQQTTDSTDRAIGKVAELACFGPRTQVLTRKGYVSMEAVKLTDELWDGVEWVSHDGLIDKGERLTLSLDGVKVTPEHPVSLGNSWTEAKLLVSNPSTLIRALAIGSANLPLSLQPKRQKSEGRWCRAAAAARSISVRSVTYIEARLPVAGFAAVRRRLRRSLNFTLSTPMLCQTSKTAGALSAGSGRLSPGAAAQIASSTRTMAAEVSRSAMSGVARTAQANSCGTSKRSTGGTYRPLRWIGETWTGIMSQVISDLLRAARTCLTKGRSQKCKPESTGLSVVYDIVNAGPRHRFTIKTDNGHLIVHNSGYGGWIGAWVAFGAEKYMDEAEIKAAILAWREASPEIVEAWGGQYIHCGPGKWDYRPELFGFEGMAISAILQPGLVFRYTDIEFFVEGDILHVRLPSGRDLHYHQPRLSIVRDRLNRGDCYQITFMGYNSNAMKGPIGWHRLETFGGRLFENGSQAIARDLQADAMVRCERRGYPVVMHLHDEIIAEVPIGQGSLAEMTEIMIERPAWASWWPIRGAGWRGERYRKD